MRIDLETDAVALGVVQLDGIALPKEYALPPLPLADGDRQPARRLYRAIGVDPTRTRPSSEALQRRLQKGKPFPRVNALVDGINYCSLTLMLPFGGYDAATIEGDVTLRLGADGEGYEGIGKPWVNVRGRYTLADARGPFGNPTSDSLRARITFATTRALITVFAPHDHPRERLDWVAQTFVGLVGGEASRVEWLP